MKVTIALATGLLAIASTAQAQNVVSTGHVSEYRACAASIGIGVVLAKMNARMYVVRPGHYPEEAQFIEARQCLKEKLKPAVDSAASNPDLKEAVKNFHAEAMAYLSAAANITAGRAYPRQVEDAEARFKPVSERLKVEIELASP